MADTLVELIQDAAGGVKAPWVGLIEGLITDALPAVLAAFGGADTPVLIAEFAIRELFSIGEAAITDLVAGHPVESVKKSIDDAVGDLLEEISLAPSLTIPPSRPDALVAMDCQTETSTEESVASAVVVPAMLCGWRPGWELRQWQPIERHKLPDGSSKLSKHPGAKRGGVRRNDITGQRFGHLVALGRDDVRKGTYWRFLCDCGQETSMESEKLRRISRRKRSCDARKAH